MGIQVSVSDGFYNCCFKWCDAKLSGYLFFLLNMFFPSAVDTVHFKHNFFFFFHRLVSIYNTWQEFVTYSDAF